MGPRGGVPLSIGGGAGTVPGSEAKSLRWLRIGMGCGQLHLALPKHQHGRYQVYRSVRGTKLFGFFNPADGAVRCGPVSVWRFHGSIC